MREERTPPRGCIFPLYILLSFSLSPSLFSRGRFQTQEKGLPHYGSGTPHDVWTAQQSEIGFSKGNQTRVVFTPPRDNQTQDPAEDQMSQRTLPASFID